MVACLGVLPGLAALPARFTAEAPQIDGRLDEAAWREARATAEFVGPLQADGLAQPANAATRVRVLWDEHTVYFGFECDGAPASSTLTQRDAELHRQEVVEVFLDLTGQGTDYVELQLSPAGVMADLRHHWSHRPTYAATHIDEEQRRNMSSDRSWNLAGWRAATTLRTENGIVTGWTAEMAVPVAALGVNALGDGYVFKANFAHYRFRAGAEGVEKLQPVTWRPVLYGRPHVSPMAMGEVRCMTDMPATAAQPAWRHASRLLVRDAHREFQNGATSREARFGEAVTLLNMQPRTESNIAQAAEMFAVLSANDAADEFALAARYYLGRIEQVHRFTPDPAKAKQIYEQLMRDHPESLYAQLAGVKVCVLTLYVSELAPTQRLAAGEQMESFFQQPEAKRDYHLVMADGYVRLGGSAARLLHHLLAADEGEMARTARGDLYARIVEAAAQTGDRRLAIDYCHKFLGLRLRAARVSIIEDRLRELEAMP